MPGKFLPKPIYYRRLTITIALLVCIGLLAIQPAAAQVDPELVSSTYLGGSGVDFGGDIAVDTAGNIYVIGFTDSTNFPATSPFGNATTGNGYRTYVTKFDPTGTTQLYSIFLGGGYGRGIAVDADGAAYVVGGGIDIPMVHAIQPTYAGGEDAFIAKINPSGTELVYSTYLGGANFDSAYGVALDSLNNAYIVGYTNSTDFPVQNAYQSVFGGGDWDTFVAKINPSGSAIVYSTYYGGNDNDIGHDIAVDDSGNAFITGTTESDNFPTINAYQPQIATPCIEPPEAVCQDNFVARFNSAGEPVYSTYLGGNGGSDESLDIAVDSTGSAYITGFTNSTDFPIRNAYQSTQPGGRAAFLTKLSPDGLDLNYSTYLGGTDGASTGVGIAIDEAGYAFVVGVTNTTDFPTVLPVQAVRGGTSSNSDLFMTIFNKDGQTILFSSYLGGSNSEGSFELSDPHIAVDSQGNIYLTSTTESNDFPLQNAFQDTPGGSPYPDQNYDAVVAKISLGDILPPEPTPIPTVSLPDAAAERNYFPTPSPILTWTTVTWAIRYRVEVETSATFNLPYTFEGEVDANVRSMLTDPLDDGVYYWRVGAQKPDGSWGWSPVQSFTIDTDG
jgi:hypothetical protein